jgi:hypothetical protein
MEPTRPSHMETYSKKFSHKDNKEVDLIEKTFGGGEWSYNPKLERILKMGDGRIGSNVSLLMYR